WTAMDGTEHTGAADAPAGSRRGNVIRIWVDENGDATDEPLGEDDVTARVVCAGAAAAAGMAALALLVLQAVRGALDRRRIAAWDRAWQRTGPGWTSRRA
ncbi:hypothetical protein ACFWX4_16025, partial [Streptomyces sp. NPDC059063]